MSSPDEFTLELRAALDLDDDERAYLGGLNLAATWRRQSAHASIAPFWGWLALFSVVAGFVVWTVAAEPLGEALSAVNMVGVGSVLLSTALGVLLQVGQTIIQLALNPALGVSQPLLALLALVLLLFPRFVNLTSPQGVSS